MTETPQFEEPIRIVSDLHFGHPASIVENPGQLAPLFRDVKTVIFNGDTVELRYLRGRRIGMRNSALVREICEAEGARPVFLNGNHDPILSELSHVDLVDGAVLVTHGDLLFHDVSPWSHEAGIMGEAHTRELAELSGDAFLDFEKRLKASKRAALAIELHRPRMRRDSLAVLRTVLRECWPPWRPFQVLHSWAVTPGRAEALARVFRPRARFIIIGHTHFSGTWRRGPRMIINTGSFLPFGGRMAVDIQGENLTLRPILIERGLFKAGSPIMQFTATKLLPGEGVLITNQLLYQMSYIGVYSGEPRRFGTAKLAVLYRFSIPEPPGRSEARIFPVAGQRHGVGKLPSTRSVRNPNPAISSRFPSKDARQPPRRAVPRLRRSARKARFALMSEIIFDVREDDVAGGFVASALGFGIHTEAETLDQLREAVKEAVDCYFDETMDAPKVIRLHFVHDEVLAR